MRRFEIWRDRKTGLYYWRLLAEHGSQVCAATLGVHSVDECNRQIRSLSMDFAHTGAIILGEQPS